MTDVTAAGAPPAGDAAPVTVITPPDTVIAKPPGWLATRLSQTSTKAAIMSVGTVWCGIGAVAIRAKYPLVADAILPTFIGVLAFLWNESPDAISISTPAIEQSPAAIVRAA